MWDKPDILNSLATMLFAAAFVMIAYGAVHYIVRLPIFPLRELSISNELTHVTRDQVAVITARELRGNFFTLDLERARAAFEKLPWVRNATVRREWPDRLEVALVEQIPVARWDNTGLVNAYGETFTAAFDGKLPQFIGPPGSAQEMVIQYGYFQRTLAAIEQEPVQVQVSPRRAWRLRLASGITLELGRENVEARLNRFVSTYARTIGSLQRRINYVDLRYPNGYAVGIPELAHERVAGANQSSQAKKARHE